MRDVLISALLFGFVFFGLENRCLHRVILSSLLPRVRGVGLC